MNSVLPKPSGYSSVSPYLMVKDALKVIDFLKKVFGAEDLRQHRRPDGSMIHAEVRIDDTVVMLAESTDDFPAFPAWMHVYVPDVDATYRRALESGGEPVQEPQLQEGDTDRRGGVKDPSGNIWWVATQVKNEA